MDDQRQRLGVLAVLPSNRRRVLLPEQRHLLETFAGQIGLALERARLAEIAESTRLAAESESLRNTLLASISHDLRTPLAVMAGAASTLAQSGAALDEPKRAALAHSIEDKAQEMSDLVSNVLDLVRLEAGRWAVAARLADARRSCGRGSAERLAGGWHDTRSTSIFLRSCRQCMWMRHSIVQVFCNLFDNIVKYTSAGTGARVSAVAR